MEEELIFDSDGNVDVEAMREERSTRKVPANPPPRAAHKGWLDGKAIAGITVSLCINSKTWINQAVMKYLIGCANRKTGACYPSVGKIAADLYCSPRSVQRAIRWWLRLRYRVNGTLKPFLEILAPGRKNLDGTKQSNAFGIGWLAFIACAAERHHEARVRAHSKAMLEQHQPAPHDLSADTQRPSLSIRGRQSRSSQRHSLSP